MAIQVSGTTVIDNNKKFLNTYNENGTAGSSFTLDLNTATVHEITLNSTGCTVNFSNDPPSGQFFSCMLIVNQDGSGNRTLSYSSGDVGLAKYTDGEHPVLSTGANQKDVLSFWTVDGGTTWYGSFVMANTA